MQVAKLRAMLSEELPCVFRFEDQFGGEDQATSCCTSGEFEVLRALLYL
jgi:hypothetical protein